MLGSLLEIIPAVLSNWQSTCPEKLLEKMKVSKQFCAVTFSGLCAKKFQLAGEIVSPVL